MANALKKLCRLALSGLVAGACGSGVTSAQSVSTEADVTVGASSEGIQAAATQVRVFGEGPGQWRFYGDSTWAVRRGHESDAFGAAYPYEPELRLMELFVEKTSTRDGRVLGLRAGRYRTPFGLYTRSDHGYTGFLRSPLIRYSEYWALSNNYLETGASLIAGTPWLTGEASLGVASDEDEYARSGGLSGVVRVQTSAGPWIIGASHIRTRPSDEWVFATGPATFTGVDVRWMQSGVQVRGEWLFGRPFDHAKTRGGYLDLVVHRPSMGPVTGVARVERLDYFAGPFSAFVRRFTVGAKVRFSPELVGQVNWIRQPQGVGEYPGHTSLDAGLTFSFRRGK